MPVARSRSAYSLVCDRAVSIYSHLSDRLGVYGTQVISCAPREALYVLTSILDNDTIMPPRRTSITAPSAAAIALYSRSWRVVPGSMRMTI